METQNRRPTSIADETMHSYFFLTKAARASQNTRGHAAFVRADTWAVAAPSNAQNRNRSSRWGKCSQMERDRRRHARMG